MKVVRENWSELIKKCHNTPSLKIKPRLNLEVEKEHITLNIASSYFGLIDREVFRIKFHEPLSNMKFWYDKKVKGYRIFKEALPDWKVDELRQRYRIYTKKNGRYVLWKGIE